MGGEGSGRPKDLVIADLIMSDTEFANQIALKAAQQWSEIADTMYRLAIGQGVEHRLTPKGEVKQLPISPETQAKCAKVWKELVLDKVIPDKKQIDVPESGNLFSMIEAMKEVADKVESIKAQKAKPVEQEEIIEHPSKIIELKNVK